MNQGSRTLKGASSSGQCLRKSRSLAPLLPLSRGRLSVSCTAAAEKMTSLKTYKAWEMEAKELQAITARPRIDFSSIFGTVSPPFLHTLSPPRRPSPTPAYTPAIPRPHAGGGTPKLFWAGLFAPLPSWDLDQDVDRPSRRRHPVATAAATHLLSFRTSVYTRSLSRRSRPSWSRLRCGEMRR
jgi:hypothetical protein